MNTPLFPLLEQALQARISLLDDDHWNAVRLFNGYSEGLPGLVVDFYASSLLLHNQSRHPVDLQAAILEAQAFYKERLPRMQCSVLKVRHAGSRSEKCGRVIDGAQPADKIHENGVWYALDLLMQQDASFYLDTRHLRGWARDHLKDKRVLNTFAYTGSLGVASLAGGAAQVIQLDRNGKYLRLAEDSYKLNNLPLQPDTLIAEDFFAVIGRFKRQERQFDCIFLDPPFFAASRQGRVDTQKEFSHLVNKLRTLVSDGGWLVLVNNALFLSGRDYLASLQALDDQGFLKVEGLIPVPQDCTGYGVTPLSAWPADPAPFNHPTKIVVLRVRRK